MTNRQDTPFWRYCRNMHIPERLAHRIDLVRETGRVFCVPNELFAENSWIQVMLGQGLTPEQYHPVVDAMHDDEPQRFLADIESAVDNAAARDGRFEGSADSGSMRALGFLDNCL